ncbi:beta-lactamase family protein [Pseudomonas aeruginosa]|uniref:serine hydrolase domain-containing protein n=1 Tax=Pseudomonas aeruginosa TaxID=287 RepID=UPI000F528EE3|nr:serine hydrolase domain-containing protein [Pseudomonas aeruginosa]MBA5081328.1 beta-lactamase family protein [Pseudomonas aeruginosa]MCS9907932.1 beta-lactamase family protein [Pseudomonas aeruginosa]MCS9925047.1 beta-lactamase family protein [Pseudomonas aeruginosa]MDI2268079.1 beta-lactamase family protein [Pseudomonas aeruginosa]MDI2279741.1 beta-lactamase family protein [Pseudomonas aeruginosa]
MSGFERGPGRSLAEHVDQAIEAAFADQRLVGAVVLVAHRGQWLYRRAAGLADREAGRTMGEDSLFRLASVSKPIVSVAALSLVDEGRLALDEPIADWLPAFRPRLADGREARITPRQLLSHSAGLGYRFLEADADGPYARAGISDGMDLPGFDLAENLRRLASVPLLYEPGRAWGYSLATDVLGALVARVDGRPLAEALRRRVGIPAGMRDSGFLCADAQRLAAVYVSDRPRPRRMAERETVTPFEDCVGIRFEPRRAFEPSAYASGGAGMIGSAGDVLRLLEVLRQGGAPLLTPGLVEEMGRDQVPGLELPANPGFGFGLGFSVLRDPAIAQSPESPGTWRWGGAYGHSWFVDRARELSVVALTNTLFEGMSGRFVNDLRDAVYRSAEVR